MHACSAFIIVLIVCILTFVSMKKTCSIELSMKKCSNFGARLFFLPAVF